MGPKLNIGDGFLRVGPGPGSDPGVAIWGVLRPRTYCALLQLAHQGAKMEPRGSGPNFAPMAEKPSKTPRTVTET